LIPTTVVDRRKLMLGSAGLAIAAAGWPLHLWAATEPYKFKQGEVEVTVISDGHLILPTGLLAPDAPPEERKAVMEAGGSAGKTFEPPTNPTLIKSGSELVLIDTGSGTGFQPTAGKLMENLKSAGIDPTSITKILFTHGHLDHLMGTTQKDGSLTFPNASYVVAGAEWDFWTDKEVVNKFPEDLRIFPLGAQKTFAAIKDKVHMVKPGDEVISGIRVLDTVGHTPGHVSYEVAGGEGLIVVGDAVLAPWVFFPHPEWKFGFDADHDAAIRSRKQLLDRAATDRIKMIGFHWPFPGVGFAERKDNAYRFAPTS
jgi:glyoxylase-like metal-dependent hydrolase (beta-lactamase superfamily II)